MRKLILLASAAAMAAAMPALAQGRGGGHGGGHGDHGKGGGQQAEAGRGGGGQQREARGNGRAERGPATRHAEKGGGNGRGHDRGARAERGGGQNAARHAERREVRAVERAARHVERDRGDRRDVREVRRSVDRDWSRWAGPRVGGDRVDYRGRSFPVRVAGDGCPPGLAKQNAFCMPPGQLRRAQMMGRRIDRDRFGAVPQTWLYRFADNDDFYHRYDDDGYIYRIDRRTDFVSAILPLFGSGLLVGEPLPLGYDAYNLPMSYRDRYADGDEHLYRYDDNAIYQVSTRTRLIQGVVALLSGNPINVGSALPTGYDAYNLPMNYRDRYADDADSLYRYSDGGIYEVDPTTMLVQALVERVL